MSRPPAFPAEQKVRIVLSILAGEITAAGAGALGEATVELRVWKKSAERLAPSRTSR